MSGRLFRAASVAAIFMGTVVGAGFASGQEILHFFTRHGSGGVWGVALSAVFLGGLGARVLIWGRRFRAESHRVLFLQAAGPVLGRAGDWFVTVLLLVLAGVMLAGSGALAVELGWSRIAGAALTALLGLGVLAFRLSGIRGFNLLVIPLLIGTGALVAGSSFIFFPKAQPVRPVAGWWISGLLYSSYNLVLAIPVLACLHRLEDDPCVLRLGGWLGGVGLGLTALLFHLAIGRASGSAAAAELPLFPLLTRWGPWFRGLYALALWGELFTTFIANVYGLVQRWGENRAPGYGFRLIAVVFFSAVVSRMGFAPLIRRVYPVFGWISLAYLITLWIRSTPGFPGKRVKLLETPETS